MSRIKKKPAHMAPAKKQKKRGWLPILLIIVGSVLFLVAGGILLFSQWRYYQQDKVNSELAAYVSVSDDGVPQVDWEGLQAINDEVVAWVYIPGTVINYPVYQHSDNSYYLDYNAYGEYSVGGQIFLDYQNTAPGMVDTQSIIYGHHLQNGAMFKQISDMDDQDTFDSVTTVWYVTQEATYELEPLLLYYTEPTNVNVRSFSFDSENEFHEYLLELLANAETYTADAESIIESTSRVLSLATCNYVEGEGRSILVCVPKTTL